MGSGNKKTQLHENPVFVHGYIKIRKINFSVNKDQNKEHRVLNRVFSLVLGPLT